MLKMAKTAEPTIKDDPKTIDRANWQNIALAAENEAIHPDWRCALYRLHRTGRITNDQREAGDRYATLIRDYRKLWFDPMGSIEVLRFSDSHEDARGPRTRDVEWQMGMVQADAMRHESEFEIKRAKRLSDKYKEARAVVGLVANVLEDLLINDIWPTSFRVHKEISHALTRLSHFFMTGTKRERG